MISLISQTYPDHEINSCLVNKYHGPQAFLPRHADNEPTIAPRSNIFTVSLGCSATIKFSEIHGNKKVEQVAEPDSLYVMSRTSQSFWQHQITKDSNLTDTDIRYSLTFRHVSETFLKSTIIIGDSNTRSLRFGTGIGTFGQNMPGQRIEAIHTTDIDPVKCCGYKNIFIHCGINDIKHYRINSPEKVTNKCNRLKQSIEQILTICPDSRVYVSPILPTKSRDLNIRVNWFNENLFRFRNNLFDKFTILNFGEFCDEYGCLRHDMGRYWNPEDPLHLGQRGVRTLAKLIRERVYSSIMSPSPSRRGYGAVLSGTGVHGDGGGRGMVLHGRSSGAIT